MSHFSKEYRCYACHKLLFVGNLPLLLEKKHTPPGETPQIEMMCPRTRCKALNIFSHDPSPYVSK